MQHTHARQTEPGSSTSVLSDGFFLSCSKSVSWYVCGALLRKAFLFLCDRSEKALVVCAVFPTPFVLGTKKCFFWGWGGKKEEEMKIASMFAVCGVGCISVCSPAQVTRGVQFSGF